MLEVSRGVRGRIHAEFAVRDGATAVRVTDSAPPLELRGPFVESRVSRFFLRNVSCGVFAGDTYDIRLRAGAGAQAYVSATSATKVHAMPKGGPASGNISIESAPGAALAFYDGPTILQRGSRLAQRVVIIAGGGLAVYAEVIVFGRLAQGEMLDFDRYESELLVRDDLGHQVYVERYELLPYLHRRSIADASPPVLGKVVFAGLTDASALARMELSGDGWSGGYDTLPSSAGVVLRVGGKRMEAVSAVVREAVLWSIARQPS